MTFRKASLAILVVVAVAAGSASFRTIRMNTTAADKPIPTLTNTCLITNDVNRLVEFYEPILKVKANRSGAEFAEFPTGLGVLAIFSAATQEK
jgi:hypothetical protein